MTEPAPVEGNTGVRSVANALRVIEALAEAQPVGVSELARLVDLPKSSVFRNLRTLESSGWARHDGSDNPRWSLTQRVFSVGLSALSDSSLQDHAVTVMRALRDRYGETVHLTVPDGADVVVISRIDGTNSLRTFLELGVRAPMLSTAGGRAMLSAMPDEVLDELLARGARRHTDRTKLDAKSIRAEVQRCRDRGYATNEAEWRADIAAIAAPVVGRSGRVIAAISISMPHARLAELGQEEAGPWLVAKCREVSRAMGSGP